MSSSYPFLIRNAREDERTAIKDLTLTAYAEYATIMAPSAWAGLHQALLTALDTELPAEWIVAEQEGTLVGSVLLFPPAAQGYNGAIEHTHCPELRLLAVLPSARGQRVGSALIKECMQRARRAGAAALGLHTSDSMQVAMRLYERLGFVRDPAYDFQPEGAELVKAYRVSLTNAVQGVAER